MNNFKSLLKFIGLAACFFLLLQNAEAEPLTVAVAANVKYAFDDLATEFKKETGIEVQGVFGASGKIVSQVKSGAPFDVFLSADTESPDALCKENLATRAPQVYAYGVLVLWTKKGIDLSKGVAVVNDASVQKVAIANPKLAPYGRAAIQALEKAGLDQAVAPRLVYGENISQTLQFADSGAADIAFVAKSLVVAPEMAGKGKWVEVPRGNYDPIAQGVVVLKHGSQSEAARKFVDFLFSPKARAIFAKYGYQLP
ncbi:MAG TPA: molybdate ABC transporter substrate-binding protein [Gallionellaceae bacterium]